MNSVRTVRSARRTSKAVLNRPQDGNIQPEPTSKLPPGLVPVQTRIRTAGREKATITLRNAPPIRRRRQWQRRPEETRQTSSATETDGEGKTEIHTNCLRGERKLIEQIAFRKPSKQFTVIIVKL